MSYKWCVVPQCTNTSISSPTKLFVSVPTTFKRRKLWLQLARRDPKSISKHSNVFMCEDHFDMEKDTKNYMKYKMGFSQKILLADEAMPTKFHCQEDRKRRLSDPAPRKVFPKRQRTELVTECVESQSATATHAESLQVDDMTQKVNEDEGTPIRANIAHNDHSYSIGSSGRQCTEIIIREKKSSETEIDLPTPDNTQETIDKLLSDASAAEASGFEDGINDNDFDACPQPTVPEYKEVQEPIFSWQKDTDWLPTEIVKDENDGVVCPSVGEALGLPGPAECSLYCDDEPAPDRSRAETIKSQPDDPIHIPELPAEYQCNECRKEIVGFRYTCVQCADWDLCGACEARTAHATHYVLRVPSPRPYKEIQAVLAAIRQQLLSENLFINQEFVDDSLKVEVKEEPGEAPPAAPEPDPLEDPHSDYHGDATQTEDSSEESDVSSSPRHKLRSHRTLRSDKTDENTATVTRDKPVLAVQNDATIFAVQDDATIFSVQDDATIFSVQDDATIFSVQDDATIFAVQDDATISDHIDLTETVSDNATGIPTSDKAIRIINSELFTMMKPTTIDTSNNATSKLAPVNPNIIHSENSKIISVDNPARKSYDNIGKLFEQENPATAISKADNKARLKRDNSTKFADKNPTGRKLAKPTSLLTTNSPARQIVQDYFTRYRHKGNAEAVPTERTMQTDDVICLDDTNTMAIEQLTADRLESETVSNVTPQASDRVEGCSEPSAARGPEGEVILRVPSDTNEVDLARALHSKVTVRLERLQIEVVEYIPVKKRRHMK